MRIAALDLGSNSFHLLVADVHADGTIAPIVRDKEMLRLGEVVGRHGAIPSAEMDRAVATVRRFRLLAESAGAAEIHACATSATRLAANGDQLVDRIEAEAGVRVKVISGLDEAQLIFTAVRASVVLDPPPALAIDIGGGSVEFMIGDATGLLWSESLRIGVGLLASEFVHSDPLAKAERRHLHERIVSEIKPVVAACVRYQPGVAVGSSGTIEALARLALTTASEPIPTSVNQMRVDREALRTVHRTLLQSDADERRKLPGMDPKRIDLIVAGSVLLNTLMDSLQIDSIVISEWALREGIVLDAASRHDPEDWSDDPHAIRRSSVLSLARRCNVDERHSRHVMKLADELFDHTRELHDLTETDRELLGYGALLHQVGRHVSSDGHQKHAAYIIRHGSLRGFSPEDVRILAGIARWQRRGNPEPDDELVGPLDRDGFNRMRQLVALLRIADGLDRGRRQEVMQLDVNVGPDLVLIGLRSDSGRTELDLWGGRRKRALFEKVFDRVVEFRG